MVEFQNTIDLLGDDVAIDLVVSRKITEFSDNLLTSIGNYAFNGCTALTSVDIPNVTSIGYYAFSDCRQLTSVDIPNVTSIGNYAFQSCTALTSVDITNVTSIGSYAFNGCTALTSVDITNTPNLGTSVFPNCTALTTLILRKPSVCNLPSTNTFSSTPFASGSTGGTVYVPQALITEYQNATNWSTLYAAGTCNFVAIEGSEYE